MLNRVRLVTGLVLFFYVTLHLLNHSFGLWSLQTLDTARTMLHFPWFNPVGQTVLYGSLLIHIGLALYALFQRRQLRMKFGEALQLVLGLTIVPLLFFHIIGTRVLFSRYGIEVDYNSVLLALWQQSPWQGLQQILVLLVAWIHGCIGIYYWSRLKPWYPTGKAYLFAAALLIPTLALVGFIQASKDILVLAADATWLSKAATRYVPDDAVIEQLLSIHFTGQMIFLALLIITLVLRALRLYRERSRAVVKLHYDNGRQIQFPPGRSILDASREAGIPHASVCGGRGRCSTCRVRIVEGAEQLPEPSDAEQKVLQRINAGANVRLACQTQPGSGRISLIRILPPGLESARDGFVRPGYMQGQEIDIAILFADLRSFTKLSEKKLPYDVVFLLNQYFHSMGAAIEQAGGHIDKFIGDGIMALFGIDSTAAEGSRCALAAARQMSNRLAELNQVLTHDLDAPLRIGMGIHTGTAIVGEMGYASAKSVTAIGDAVNTASRLEPLTKEYAVELIVSEITVTHAGIDLSNFEQQDISIRGREQPLQIRIVPSASALPQIV